MDSLGEGGCACVCVIQVGDVIFLMCDCVCGCVGIVLAVNIKLVESKNMSNVYVLN